MMEPSSNPRPYVTGVILERFGAAEDVSHTGFSPGLNVISGRNEAGKSTLRNAIPAAFMGWPSARGNQNPYRKGSGRRAVTILMQDGEHELVFRRDNTDVTITRDGRDMDPQEFADRYLTGVDEELFKKVLSLDAFSASSITDSPGLADSFMMAGSGASVSPVELQNSLTREAKGLFTTDRRMTNVLIRNLTTELREQDDVILTLRNEAHRINESALRLSEMDTELERSKQELEQARSQEETLKRSVERVERLESAIRDAEDAREEVMEELAAAEDEVKRLPVDDHLVDSIPSLQHYSNDINLVSEQLRELRDLRTHEEELVDALPVDAPRLADEPQVVIDHLQQMELARLNAANEEEQAATRLEEARAELTAVERTAGIEVDLERMRALSAAQQRPFYIAAAVGFVLAIIAGVLGWQLGQPALYVVAGMLVLGVFIALIMGALRSEKRIGTPADLQDRTAHVQRARAEVSRAESLYDLKRKTAAELAVEVESYLTQQGIAAEQGGLQRSILYATRARERQQKESEIVKHRERAQKLEQRIASWVAEAAHELPFLPVEGEAATAPQLIRYIPTTLEEARAQEAARRGRLDAMARIDTLRTNLTRSEERLEELRFSYTTLSEELGIPVDEDPLVTLQSRIRKAGETVEELESAHSALNDEHGVLRERIRITEVDSRLDFAVQEAEDIRAQIQDARERYLYLTVKSQLLDRALDTWSIQRKPGIDSAADAYLADLTEGRWTRIVSDGQTYSIQDRVGTKLDDKLLSSGTQAQMHLALRLALIESSPDLAPGAPVLLDDILVHFDESRQRQALLAIQRLARTRQVMYFTHDLDLAAAMEEAGAYHKQLG